MSIRSWKTTEKRERECTLSRAAFVALHSSCKRNVSRKKGKNSGRDGGEKEAACNNLARRLSGIKAE